MTETRAQNNINLTGRNAIVTGGAQGIGRAVALRLARSGARVAIWDMDREGQSLAEEIGGHFEMVDQSIWSQVELATRGTLSTFGAVDILINNAGIAGGNAPTWEYPVLEWQQIINVDLNGVFYCCRSIVPGMRTNGYGRIVNIASIAGKEGNPNASAYSSAKAGVIALTKSLGKELAGQNISVNCITPAVAKTRLFEQMQQSQIDYMLAKVPRGRFLELDEVAAMVAWLASEENSFTTAAVFDLSGGRATY